MKRARRVETVRTDDLVAADAIARRLLAMVPEIERAMPVLCRLQDAGIGSAGYAHDVLIDTELPRLRQALVAMVGGADLRVQVVR